RRFAIHAGQSTNRGLPFFLPPRLPARPPLDVTSAKALLRHNFASRQYGVAFAWRAGAATKSPSRITSPLILAMPLLTLQDAELAFGLHPLLDGADFVVDDSERIGLIGRNGTGKSSLLQVI